MSLWLIMLIALMNHSTFKGSKVLMSLTAIDLAASPATIGVLYAMYSAFPVLLSVYAGKFSDRHGFRLPALIGSCGLLVSLLVPFVFPHLAMLFVAASIAGMCHIFYVVAIQHLIGSIGEGVERTRNYSIFALCVGVTTLVGPLVSGFSIDAIGHRAAWLVLAGFPAVAVLVLLMARSLRSRPLPPQKPAGPRRVLDLIGNAPLRRVLLATAFLETGMEAFNFLMPIYGHSIGLTASQIGVVMGAFGLALMAVRSVMTALVRRSSEERVFSLSLVLAGAACVAFPLVSSFALLLVMSFVLGLGLGCGAPLSMTLSYNRAPAARTGEAIGLRQTVNKGIETTMPLVFGLISAAIGALPVYWLGALVLASGGWLMHGDASRRSHAPSMRPPH
ncbi:MAG TPA: MFS transporter [Burkholderiales bacterium]|jgi:MFS family permease